MSDSIFWIVIMCGIIAVIAIALALWNDHKQMQDIDWTDGHDNWHKDDFNKKD